MPRLPPGICHREIYSDLLAKAGLLFDRRYKAHQLTDLSQLQRQAQSYLEKSLSTGLPHQGDRLHLDSDETKSHQSISGVSVRNELSDDSTTESVTHSPPGIFSRETLQQRDVDSNGFQHVGTSVILTRDDPDDSGLPEKELDTNTDTPSATVARATTRIGSTPDAPVVRRSTSVSDATTEDVRIQIDDSLVNQAGVPNIPHAEDEALRSLDYKRVSRSGIWCLVVQIFVSAALVVPLYFFVLLNWHEKFRSFHIVYPFVVHFCVRVIVMGSFTLLLKRYIRSCASPPSAAPPTATGIDGFHWTSSLVNFICIFLAVVAAALPYGATDAIAPQWVVTNVYLGIIAAILAINILATLLYFRAIGRLVYSSNIGLYV
ncbi:thiamine pathway transporter THI73-like protein [Babesia caballi]|uniref:Thiamine pathway transporter THI73-like protein n=1 Tax=Babesia caballi TaxID=5871 RepID=A0AAV4LPL4_BABCB|nr:thiamine pathway transporter THI73-like protein [Babesia caballi]